MADRITNKDIQDLIDFINEYTPGGYYTSRQTGGWILMRDKGNGSDYRLDRLPKRAFYDQLRAIREGIRMAREPVGQGAYETGACTHEQNNLNLSVQTDSKAYEVRKCRKHLMERIEAINAELEKSGWGVGKPTEAFDYARSYWAAS